MALLHNATLSQEPAVELGARERQEQPHHGQWNSALLDKLHLFVEDVLGIAVKAHDEPGHDLHAVALDAVYAVEEAATRILELLGLLQAFLHRGFDAQEDPGEAGVFHHL